MGQCNIFEARDFGSTPHIYIYCGFFHIGRARVFARSQDEDDADIVELAEFKKPEEIV